MIAAIGLSSYGLIIATNGIIMPYLLLLMGLMAIVMGIIEFQKRKATALTLFLVAGLVLFVGVYTL